MSNSGYHVTISAFVPFDPRNPKTVAKQAKALEHLVEGNTIDAAQLGALAPAMVKKVNFMQTMPKHMAEAMKPEDDEPKAAKK